MIQIFSYTPTGAGKESKPYKFAHINGKTYQVLRGYERERSHTWLQVAGSPALRPADLDKQWKIMGAKGFYIAYVDRYFNFKSERADLKLIFIGNSTSGSRFLALWFMACRYGLDYSESGLASFSQVECDCWRSYRFGTSFLDEFVSEDDSKKAILVEFANMDYEKSAQEFFNEIQKVNK